MAINRLSQGPIAADVQSSFIPLPIDLIDRQIQRKQSQYDTTKAFIGEAKDTLYGIQSLSSDRDVLKSTIGQYESDIEKEVEKVGGDYSRLTGVAEQFGSKLKKDIMQGHLGAIHNNFIKAQAHMQELDERRKKGDISEAGYNLGLESISAFGGTVQTEDGGYTKAAFYSPTQFVELGKLGDEYGKVINDQYTRDGRKYISGAEAQKLISHNLWNNPQAVANAREQVRVALPKEQWGTEAERVALHSFIDKIAKDSGYKLQYMQQFRDEGTDNLTGGNVISYDLIGTRPANSLISTEGTEFNELMKQSKKTSRIGSVLSFIRSIQPKVGSTDEHIVTMGEDGRIAYTTVDRSEAIKIKYNEEATKIVSKLAEQDLVRDLAEINGVDLSNPNYETLVKLEDAVEQLNKSSANTRLTLQNDEKTFDAFKSIINSGTILNMRVEDATTGERLPLGDVKKILATHAKAKGEGEGALIYAGEVNTKGQAYPFGSSIATYNDPNGEARQVIIDIAQNKGTMEYLQDRVLAAKNLGSSNFRLGDDHYQFLRTPDGSVAAYKNGKAMTVPKDPKNPDIDNPENQQRIYYK